MAEHVLPTFNQILIINLHNQFLSRTLPSSPFTALVAITVLIINPLDPLSSTKLQASWCSRLVLLPCEISGSALSRGFQKLHHFAAPMCYDIFLNFLDSGCPNTTITCICNIFVRFSAVVGCTDVIYYHVIGVDV